MKKIAQHKVLVSGRSFEACCKQVRKFFDQTSLVRYDSTEVVDTLCLSGKSRDFFQHLNEAESCNRQRVASLIGELKQTGVSGIDDLVQLEHGYPSKVLHILSHLLDGFIGIDSSFYNFIDDSHWISENTAARIRNNPDEYWLIHIDGFSATPEEAGLLRM